MEFDNYTREKLKRILKELDFESNGYDWGSDEHEFLMEICAQIEDALRGDRRWTFAGLVLGYQVLSLLTYAKKN